MGPRFSPELSAARRNDRQLGTKPTIVALTATATPKAAEDIENLLIPAENQVKTGFARENLAFQVVKDQKDTYITTYLKMNQGQSGIIYASTRKEVERIYHLLKHEHVSVGYYHGGLSEEERLFPRRISMTAYK